MKAIKVKELNSYLKKIVSMDFLLSNIAVEGEISNFKAHENGNLYFSLKDDFSRINAIIFYKNAINLDFKMEDGLKIIAKGSVNYYEKDSQITLYISEIISHSSGNLYAEFVRLKKKLSKEGLFDPWHKLKIPTFPKTIGIITSASGAAVKDIVNMLKMRNNLANIIIFPSLVQGDDAPSDLIEGIKYFNDREDIDLIILGRGGGSFEDLFCFNDENLAKAIYNSNIPIISAVGHEVDYSISDFVADMRAATPTKAAEIAIISKKELSENLKSNYELLNSSLNKIIFDMREKLSNYGNLLRIFCPLKDIFLNKDNLKDRFNRLNISLKSSVFNNQKILEYGVKSIKSYDFKIEERKVYLEDKKLTLVSGLSQKINIETNKLNYYYKLLNYNMFQLLRSNSISLKNFKYYLKTYKVSDEILKKNLYLHALESRFKAMDFKTDFRYKKDYLYNKKYILNNLTLNIIKNERNKLNTLIYNLNTLYNDINKVKVYLKDGSLLKDIRQINEGDFLNIHLKNGVAKAQIKDIEGKNYAKRL